MATENNNEKVRLVRGTAVLFDFDLQSTVRFGGKLLLAPSVTFRRLTVPVYEGERTIGACTLFMSDRKVMGLISFDYYTPERLDLMVGTPVHAIPMGEYLVDVSHPKWSVCDEVAIYGVKLGYEPGKEGIGSEVQVTHYDELE